MSNPRHSLPRPTPRTPYRILVRNSQVLADWEKTLNTRRERCIDLWDHISTTPLKPIGSRYLPLKGTQKFVDYAGEKFPQWQYEIDRGARVKVGVGKDFVVVVSASTGHPKENE
jgi:hypothetical protein